MKIISINQVVTLMIFISVIFPFLGNSQSTNDYEVCLGATESYWVESPGAGSTFAWSITPGSSGLEWTIVENNNDTIQIEWLQFGIYTIQILETNSDGCNGDPVTLMVTVTESPTVALAGPDQIICGSLDASMAGNIAIVGSGIWSQVSGPGTIIFTIPNDPLTNVTASDYGEYILRWTISNGACPESIDDVTIRFSPKPVTNGIWHN